MNREDVETEVGSSEKGGKGCHEFATGEMEVRETERLELMAKCLNVLCSKFYTQN